MVTTLAVSGWLLAALMFSGVVYHKAQSAHFEAEVARYENELRVIVPRTIEQKQRYTMYRRDL